MFAHNEVRIRPVKEKDLENLLELRHFPQVWKNLGFIEMLNIENQKSWLKKVSIDTKQKYYILNSKEIDFLGLVRTDEIDYINKSIRVGGDIHPKHQGKGYGTKMYSLLKKYCFDYLNMNRIWLLVLETNKIARHLYRKSGFIDEGRQRQAIYRDGKYKDYLMMSILRKEYEKAK